MYYIMSMSDNSSAKKSLHGAAYIREFASLLSTKPGVYRMIDGKDEVLYIGKAKHLKHRVSNYANKGALSTRILRMVELTVKMEVIETRNEAEALLLEANLIKKFKPRYNILLKDDKSYPYIRLTNHEFPRIEKHRGTQKKGDRYFGPFASAGAVKQTIDTLQRAFLLRPCSDSIFNNRSRPCLQYQIKRCSAPCVGYVSQEGYQHLMDQAQAFLKGKSREVQQSVAEEMQAHSEAMNFEQAALCRDRIKVLTQIQQQQTLYQGSLDDADVIACHVASGQACLQVWFFRAGQHYGNHAYFPSNAQEREKPEIIAAFIGQYYQSHPIPKEILVEVEPEDKDTLQEALSLLAEKHISITVPQRGDRKQLIIQLQKQAENALSLRLAERKSELAHLKSLQILFDLPVVPKRIEVYDNSHISGTHAVGAMICSGEAGFEKNNYRRFTIRNTELSAGDDYGMMREVLTRRLKRLQKEDADKTLGMWPDVLLIDGGKGQMSAVTDVMNALNIHDVPYVCISKGPDRNAGREQFHMPNKDSFQLPLNDPTLHYLQRLRDEAHRFAITSHRIKRSNAIRTSVLDDIAGIGATRKKALMMHFGSAKAVETASLKELQNTPNINAAMAQRIYDYFNG
jgi:excinuclease ABC subunit C